MLIHFRGATARHHHFMAVAISFAQSTLFSKPFIFLHRHASMASPFPFISPPLLLRRFGLTSGGNRWSQIWSSVESTFPKMKIYLLLNFDDVLVPPDHASRSYNDTCYIDPQTILRFHTSAYHAELLGKGHTDFPVTGDVYCRDSIDSTHYPVFHQMEGVHVFFPGDWEASGMDGTFYAAEDLKKFLEGLAR